MVRLGFIGAAALGLVCTLALGGNAGAAAPTLEIVNMTKYPATVVVDRAGAAYGHYSIPAYGKVSIYGDGFFAFTGTVATAPVSTLPRKTATLATGPSPRGLIIEHKGSIIEWTFGVATSGAIM
jgi:hypothetical protein